MIAIAALDCALRRPRRRQPTTLPVAALWMAAPYHPVTNASRAIFLAIPLPPLARRPLLAPVTSCFATSAPDRRPGSDRRYPRLEPHPSPRRRSNARRARPVAAFAGVHAGRKGTLPARHRRGARRARPERHAQGFGLDLAKPTAWAELGIVALARNARSCSRCRSSRASSGCRAARNPPRSARQCTPQRTVGALPASVRHRMNGQRTPSPQSLAARPVSPRCSASLEKRRRDPFLFRPPVARPDAGSRNP